MARKKDTAWLIDGVGPGDGGARKSKPSKRRSEESDASSNPWLAVPELDPEEALTPERRSRSQKGARTSQRDRRRLVGKLRHTERKLEASERRVAELEAEVERLENGHNGGGPSTPAPPKRRPRRKAKVKAKVKAKPKVKPAARRKPTGINDVSFEELREFGLSVTQSARLIAAREMRGGINSSEELAELHGFPAETVEALSRRFSF